MILILWYPVYHAIMFLFSFIYTSLYLPNESFVMKQQTIPYSPTIVDKYNKFISFYNPFLINWEEAIITIVSLESPPPKEATSPTQKPSVTIPSKPSKQQMNQMVSEYSKKTGKSYPFLTDKLSDDINSYSIDELMVKIPSDSMPYLNALGMMNEKLADAQKNLDDALKGNFAEGFLMVEGYSGDKCAEIQSCYAEYEKQKAEQEIRLHQQKENDLVKRFDTFNENDNLLKALNLNNTLFEQSREIQNKAKSGEIFNMIKFPDKNPLPPYKIPRGGNRLSQMKESDPEKYKEYEKNYSSLFSVKQLFEQINSNLR